MSGNLASLLIGLAPLALLVGSLLLGRYPGEGSIARARRALERALRPVASGSSPNPRRQPFGGSVRGGRLIARSLAGRGPPFAG